MSIPAITAEHVSKTFFGGKAPMEVLKDINIEITEGEFVVIVGRSGCGKSTFLRMICGLETCETGTIRRKGVPVSGTDTDCGMVFQDPRLMPWLTVAQNVGFGLEHMSKEQRSMQVEEHLKLVGLEEFAGHYPAELSGGMAQRAAIARGLAASPSILLLDEPFAALDALTRMQMQKELFRIQKESGITMVMVTHDVEEALFLGNRILVMSSRPGQTEEIMTVPDEVRGHRSGDAFTSCKEKILSHFFRKEAEEAI